MGLLPYADSQPYSVKIESKSNLISRMPMLADENGINPQFQEFYNTIIEALDSGIDGYLKLYEISDKFLNEQDFKHSYIKSIYSHISVLEDNNYNFDVEVDMNMLNKLHRNILGAFNIIYYKLDETMSDITIHNSTKLYLHKTKLYFTYKDGKFMIVSYFKPFEEMELD